MDLDFATGAGTSLAEKEHVHFLGKHQKSISLQAANSLESLKKLNSFHQSHLQPSLTSSDECRNGNIRRLNAGNNTIACLVKRVFFTGLCVALKISSLLLCKVFYPKSWSVMQILGLSQLLPRRQNSVVSSLFKLPFISLEPLKWPVVALTVSKMVCSLFFPDVYRTSQFWRRLMPIYTRYMITKVQARRKSGDEKEKIWAKRHEWGGKEVHRLVLDMSGFYVKSAQILASKADFVPEAWRKRLVTLLDNAPARPFKEVKKNIQRQLLLTSCGSDLVVAKGNVSLEDVFLVLETIPLATASIAQVHGAVLKDGTRVVIKVQHAGMEKIMSSDLRNLARVSNFLQGQLPVNLAPVVKEIQVRIPEEFDFEREIWFMSTIKQSLEAHGFDRIVCPTPVTELCAKRLIVMKRLDGIPFTQILQSDGDDHFQRKKPEMTQGLHHLLEGYGQMLLVDGVFHADPHAGNLMLMPDGRIGLLDFGQSKVLDVSTRSLFAKLVLSIASNEDLAIANALLDSGMLFENVSGKDLPASILAKMARVLFDTCYMEEATVSPMSDKSILKANPLTSFNPNLWMIVRTILLLRGLCFSLHIDVSAATIWQPYALLATQNDST